MTKRLQINIRSNSYIDALLQASLESSEFKDKTEFVHHAIERLAFEVLGPEEVMNIRLYQQFNKN